MKQNLDLFTALIVSSIDIRPNRYEGKNCTGVENGTDLQTGKDRWYLIGLMGIG